MYSLYSVPLEIKSLVRNLLTYILNVKITGEQFLDINQNGFIVSNHLDHGDVLIPLIFFDKPLYLLYPWDINNIPLLKFIFTDNFKILNTMMKNIFISNEELKNFLIYESKSKFIFVFPEIHPSRTGIIQPFNEFMIQTLYECARLNQIPIFPAGIQGTYKLSEVGSIINSFFNKIRVNFNIGNPIYVNDIDNYKSLQEELQKQVYALSLHPERRKQSRAIIKTEAREL